MVTATPMRQKVKKMTTFLFFRCWTSVNEIFCIDLGNELATMRPRVEDRKTRSTAVEIRVNRMVGQLPSSPHLEQFGRLFI